MSISNKLGLAVSIISPCVKGKQAGPSEIRTRISRSRIQRRAVASHWVGYIGYIENTLYERQIDEKLAFQVNYRYDKFQYLRERESNAYY